MTIYDDYLTLYDNRLTSDERMRIEEALHKDRLRLTQDEIKKKKEAMIEGVLIGRDPGRILRIEEAAYYDGLEDGKRSSHQKGLKEENKNKSAPQAQPTATPQAQPATTPQAQSTVTTPVQPEAENKCHGGRAAPAHQRLSPGQRCPKCGYSYTSDSYTSDHPLMPGTVPVGGWRE